jgi:hypothetical protein
MLHDLDATVASLVESELAVKNVSLSFAAPDERFPPSGVTLPAIGFFLYDVRENYGLRDTQWELTQVGDQFARKRPPVRVDCSYLITAWPSDSAPNPSQDEHRLLGGVMKVLLSHRQIPEKYLKGEFKGGTPPLRTQIIAEQQLKSVGEFWQAMGGKPKAALNYKVTISVDVSAAQDAGPMVKKHQIKLTQKQVS